jgi:hypothetical protein
MSRLQLPTQLGDGRTKRCCRALSNHSGARLREWLSACSRNRTLQCRADLRRSSYVGRVFGRRAAFGRKVEIARFAATLGGRVADSKNLR